MFRTLIVDDESSARQNIKSLLESYRPGDLIIEAQNADEALQILDQHSPHLLFLDIEMPRQSGIELLQELRKRNAAIHVVFVTAYSNFAIDALKCEAFDYILKPINKEEFKKTMDRLENKMDSENPSLGSKVDQFLSNFNMVPLKINTKRGVHLINPDNIIYVKSQSNYSEIFTNNSSSLLVSKTLSSIEELLPKSQFLCTGRSHIINKNYLISTDRISKKVTLIAGDEPILLELSVNDIRKLEKQF